MLNSCSLQIIDFQFLSSPCRGKTLRYTRDNSLIQVLNVLGHNIFFITLEEVSFFKVSSPTHPLMQPQLKDLKAKLNN